MLTSIGIGSNTGTELNPIILKSFFFRKFQSRGFILESEKKAPCHGSLLVKIAYLKASQKNTGRKNRESLAFLIILY